MVQRRFDASLRVMPAIAPIALGTAPLGNLYAAVDDDSATATLDAAWRAGIRQIDTAPYYGFGLSEARIGRHRRCQPERSFAIATKVGRRLEPCAAGEVPHHGFVAPLPARPVFDYSRGGVNRGFADSLERLSVAKVECLLLHDIGKEVHGPNAPAVLRQALDEALPAMAALKRQGLAGTIGLGVNEWEVCDAVLERAEVDVVLLAGRYTLLDRSAAGFLERARARGVEVFAAGVFNSGLLAGGTTFDYAPASPALLAARDRLAAICARHGVALPAAAIRFAARHPAIARVVIGLRSPAEVAQAVAWHAAAIPDDLWQELAHERLIDDTVPAGC
jgi:D-threo-aldose 1-dehydrogenase